MSKPSKLLTLLRLIRFRLNRRIRHFHFGLGKIDALPQLVILGLLSGLISGAVIELFRWVIEQPPTLWMPDGLAENFEGFDQLTRIVFILTGALLIGLLFTYFRDDKRKAGVAYVIERLHNHQGYLPLQNGILQFVGAAIAIISGQSVGREGPAVHLGATSSSLLGQWLKLPNNSLRTLVGCGTAAAIAASFNTPLAGVIFAMEVVMMEYTLAGFAPIIIASVTGAVIAQISHGQAPAFQIPEISMHSLWELPYIAFEGFVIGCAADIEKLTEMAGPWPVNGAALRIATTALADRDWAQATTQRLRGEADQADALARSAEWSVVGGTELFRLYDTGNALAAQERLARHQIWSRIFPYSDRWLRLGLPAGHAEWARLAQALEG